LGFELQSDLNLRLLGFVWEFGGEGRVLEKRKEQVEEIEDIGRRRLWALIFNS